MAAAEALFDDGRLMDEEVVRAPSVVASVRKGKRDLLKRMRLARHSPPSRKRAVVKHKAATTRPKSKTAIQTPAPSAPIDDFVLI
jgi:hypothetical protein